MSTLELFDLAVAGRGEGTVDTTVRLAERLVNSLVTEVQYLWDLFLSFDPEKEPKAEADLRTEFEGWAQRADAAMARVKRWGNQVHGFQELQHQHGRVGAMLSVTLEAALRARLQIREGRTHSREEVMRELHLGPFR